MPVVEKTIRISAPIEVVFDVVTLPDNWIRYVTSLAEVWDFSAEGLSSGTTFKWEYRMMGFKIKGEGTVAEYDKDARFALQLHGRFPIRQDFTFSDSGEGATELLVRIEYEVPKEMLMILPNTSIIEKLNDLESRNVLEKIKTLCEERR